MLYMNACDNFCTLPFYSLTVCFVDVMFHCTLCKSSWSSSSLNSGLLFIAFLLSLVPSTHLHHADAHFFVMLAVVNCNVPVSDLNCSHSFYDTDQRPVAISELYLSTTLLFLTLTSIMHTHPIATDCIASALVVIIEVWVQAIVLVAHRCTKHPVLIMHIDQR